MPDDSRFPVTQPSLNSFFQVFSSPPAPGLVYFGSYAPHEQTGEVGTYKDGNYQVRIEGAVEGNPQSGRGWDRQALIEKGHVGVYARPGTREAMTYAPWRRG